jgi:hypothetical protein
MWNCPFNGSMNTKKKVKNSNFRKLMTVIYGESLLDIEEALITAFVESGVLGLDPSKLAFDCIGKPEEGETTPTGEAATACMAPELCPINGKLDGTIMGCIIGCTIIGWIIAWGATDIIAGMVGIDVGIKGVAPIRVEGGVPATNHYNL